MSALSNTILIFTPRLIPAEDLLDITELLLTKPIFNSREFPKAIRRCRYWWSSIISASWDHIDHNFQSSESMERFHRWCVSYQQEMFTSRHLQTRKWITWSDKVYYGKENGLPSSVPRYLSTMEWQLHNIYRLYKSSIHCRYKGRFPLSQFWPCRPDSADLTHVHFSFTDTGRIVRSRKFNGVEFVSVADSGRCWQNQLSGNRP